MPAAQWQDAYFPWTHLGLRANPFLSLSKEVWSRIAILPQQIETWLSHPTAILQITGDKGSGKTSALLALQQFFIDNGRETDYLYIDQDEDVPVIDLDPHKLLIIDEAQRLPESLRARVFNWAQNKGRVSMSSPLFIFSSHHDLSSEMKRYSLDHISIDVMESSVSDLTRMFERRIQFFTMPDQQAVCFEAGSVVYLLERFGADLRAMEAFLYDFFQAVPEDSTIEAAELDDFNRSSHIGP